MIGWLFSWPPTPLDFTATVTVTFIAWLTWGYVIASKRVRRGKS